MLIHEVRENQKRNEVRSLFFCIVALLHTKHTHIHIRIHTFFSLATGLGHPRSLLWGFLKTEQFKIDFLYITFTS